MGAFFTGIYRFLRSHRWTFWLLLVSVSAFILITASRIRLEEDISRITSDDDSLFLDEYVIRNFKFAERLIVHIRQVNDSAPPAPDALINLANLLNDSLKANLDSTIIRSIFLRVEASYLPRALNLIDDHLPLFLEERDYLRLDSLGNRASLEAAMRNNFKTLVSPASVVMKQRVVTDPLGLSAGVLGRLNTLRVDDQYLLRDGYIFSQDSRHLLFFITPANPPSETAKNGKLIQTLDRLSEQLLQVAGEGDPEGYRPVEIDYFGSVAVAVGNARQLKADILLSLSLALLAIFLLIGWYFRNPVIPLIGFLPAFFGGGLALGILYLVKGSISAIALGIGSVILGLIIDYALYMINQYRSQRDAERVIRDMALTIFVCALTSVGAFLCLVFLSSAVLHDLGWFAAISVTGAALFSLLILPQFLGSWLLPKSLHRERSNWVDRIASVSYGRKPWLIIGLAVAGMASLFFVKRVSFESDMNSLNFMPERLQRAEQALDRISASSLKKVYLVSTGKTMDQALQCNERVIGKLEGLRERGHIGRWSGIGALLLSDSIQQVRLSRWDSFWTRERKERMLSELRRAGLQAGFTRQAFTGFEKKLNGRPVVLSDEAKDQLRTTLFEEWIQETERLTMVTAVASVTEDQKQAVYDAFSGEPGVVLFDRQNLTGRFVEHVRDDFNRLVALSMIFVSFLLLLSFGRIELGFATALPMFFAWLLTLGFMGLFGIRFNIFNIIISSFVFGLGVDYSILMMRGLLTAYRTGAGDLKTYRVSIFLSSTTTIFGVAALFAARHPALSSIALISVVGVAAVVLISYSYQELLAAWFLFKPKRKHQPPVTLFNAFYSLVVAWIPISSVALILVIYGTAISPLLPLPKRRKQEIFHRLFSRMSGMYIAMNFPRYHRVENPGGETFEKPAIIISNHQSLIETPALLRLNPKILILTTKWVYRHWVFGPVARLAGFPPMAGGIDNSLHIIKQRLDEGFSILIFPEGTRSRDGRIQRFHRGAFYIAEKLQVDILPILIFGSGDFLSKGNFWGRPSRLFMKIMPRITPDDQQFGPGYAERARFVRRHYVHLYHDYQSFHGTPEFYRLPVRLNYLFKGPVLEWYVRVKMRLERNFRLYHDLLPKKGSILDLGCGYGYISYMLQLASVDRRITGVDFDEEKIITARNGYLKNDRIEFIHADVTSFPVTPHDGILLGDLLHYLLPEKQDQLLERCMENLLPGGVLLIREGIREFTHRHRRTRFSEFCSTRFLRFNRTAGSSGQLWFVSAEEIRSLAESNGLSCEIVDQGKKSSNVFLVIKKV